MRNDTEENRKTIIFQNTHENLSRSGKKTYDGVILSDKGLMLGNYYKLSFDQPPKRGRPATNAARTIAVCLAFNFYRAKSEPIIQAQILTARDLNIGGTDPDNQSRAVRRSLNSASTLALIGARKALVIVGLDADGASVCFSILTNPGYEFDANKPVRGWVWKPEFQKAKLGSVSIHRADGHVPEEQVAG